ncbi:MAG TPA: pitrilysin family protein, partial [Methylomirabilota bacterium]|nr:pitrilysin family protein [Methylomirabilota bacterium]
TRAMTHATVRALALLLAVLALAVHVPPAPAAPLAHREVLPNGIVLLVAERPAVPIVVVRAFTRAGAVFEPADRAGLANLTGALLTRGTARRTAQQLDTAIEFVGGSLEASAGRDGLTASLSVLRRDLDLGLDLLAEVLLSPAFPEAELKRRVARIQAAIKRSEEDPGTVAWRALAPLVYPGHPYGRPVEGTVESVGRLTRDDVVAFYRRHVRPDTAIVAVVGAVTVDEARRHVLARLGGWAAPAVAPASVPVAGPGGPPRAETIKKELTQATILLGRQAVRQQDPDYFPLTVAAYVLGGGSASRLYGRVREEDGLAYSVYSYASPGKYGAALLAGAQTRTAEVPRVLDLVRAELARMTREAVTDEELRLAKDYLVGSFALRLDTSAKVADFLVAVEEQGLGLDYADRYRAGIARVTPADVQRVAARFLGPDGFNRVAVGALP